MGILLAGCQTTSAPPGSDSGSKPVISSFTATPPSIAAGAQSTLSWSVSGATSLSITGLGTVSGESIVVQPETTTTYTLTASNSAGSATMDATVIVGDSGGGGGGGGDTAAAYFLPFDVDGGVTNTIYTAMAVGGDGVVHVVYAENGTADNTPLYYGECAGPCTGPDNFTMVSLPSGWSSPSMLNLAVDASGHPRLLWEVYRGFGYAECEGGCTNAANWTVTTIDVGTSVLDGSNRMLALDASGRPRVLYNDDTSSHYGTFLLSCDSACATTGTWSESLAFGDPLTRPSLVITASGVPVFAAIQEGNPEAHLLYLECPDATCSSPAAGVQLPDASYFYSDYALRLTDDGRPRIVLSTGGGADGLNSNEPNPVLYLWCDGSCSDFNNWFGYDIGVNDTVYNPLDLRLNASGLPQVALVTSDGMSYLWCASACETGAPVWSLELLDSSDALQQEYPGAPQEGGSFPMWSFGSNTFGNGVSLSLDGAGSAHLAYDARHTWMDSGFTIHTDTTWSRYIEFSAP